MRRGSLVPLWPLSAVAVVLLTRCGEEPKPAPSPPASAPARASLTPPAAPAPRQPAADAHAESYNKAKALLDEWEGEGQKLREAREMLLAILAQDKNYAPAYVGLARCEYKRAYINYDNYDPQGLRRSRRFVGHAIKLDPQLHEAHRVSAWIWIFEKEFDLARQSIERAEELKPGDVEEKALLMEIASKEQDLDEAARLAREILASTKDERSLMSAYSTLDGIYEHKGDISSAAEMYEQALRLEPNSAWKHGNYASFLLRNGRTEKAVEHAEKAVGIMPYPMGVSILARAYVARANELYAQQRQREAGQYLEKLARMAGANAQIYYQLGVFYRAAAVRFQQPELLPRAAAMFEKALQLDPEYQAAKLELDRLRARRGVSK